MKLKASGQTLAGETVKRKDGLMGWGRIEAWGYTILGLFFILGFVLQSLPMVATVMALALVLLWIKK